MTGLPPGALLHFGIAALCLFLAALQLALGRSLEGDRLPSWTALSMGGLGLLNLSVAGAGAATHGTLGPPSFWLLFSVLGTVGIPGTMLTIWHIVGATNSRLRRVYFTLLVLGTIGLAIGNLVFIVGTWGDPGVTWQALDARTPASPLQKLLGPSISVVGMIEALLALRRGSRVGWAIVVTAMATFSLGALHGILGPDAPFVPVAVIGLPMLLLASGVMVARFRTLIGKQAAAGGYRLIRRLSAGGMGELHLATRIGAGGFERPVALKRVLVRPGDKIDPRSVDRLLAEARMAARLVHPNLIAVQDVGRIDGAEGFGWFIAMEYLPGVDLKQVRDAVQNGGKPLEPGFVALIGREVCRGLAYAHREGIVHRDVSPHNVMVTFEGAVKLVDFGVAIERGDASADEPGYVMGKIGYASPEQIRGSGTHAVSDLFSLGVVLYELLTGRRPFLGFSAMEVAASVMLGKREPLRALRGDVPVELVAIIDRALSPAPTGRFTDAKAMGDALAAFVATQPPCDPGEVVRVLCADDVALQRAAVAVAVTAELPTDSDPTRRIDRTG